MLAQGAVGSTVAIAATILSMLSFGAGGSGLILRFHLFCVVSLYVT